SKIPIPRPRGEQEAETQLISPRKTDSPAEPAREQKPSRAGLLIWIVVGVLALLGGVVAYLTSGVWTRPEEKPPPLAPAATATATATAMPTATARPEPSST